MTDTLWTPGMMPGIKKRDVETLTRQEMFILARAAEVCAKYGIALVCPKCDGSFTGTNLESDRVWAIRCACRELKAEIKPQES